MSGSVNNIVVVNPPSGGNQVVVNFTPISILASGIPYLAANQTFTGINTFTQGIVGSISNLTGGTAGEVPYQSSANTTSFTAVGTAGQILQSNGASAPTWVNNNALAYAIALG